MPEEGLGNSPCRFVIRPNGAERVATMLSGGCLVVVAGVAAGVGFVYFDLWPVGLWVSVTMAALGVTIFVVGVRGKWCQVILIDSDVVVVETGQHQKHRDVFSRAWVRLEWHHFNSRHYVSRLYLRSRGHRVEIGPCLTSVERQTLAQQLEASLPAIPA